MSLEKIQAIEGQIAALELDKKEFIDLYLAKQASITLNSSISWNHGRMGLVVAYQSDFYDFKYGLKYRVLRTDLAGLPTYDQVDPNNTIHVIRAGLPSDPNCHDLTFDEFKKAYPELFTSQKTKG